MDCYFGKKRLEIISNESWPCRLDVHELQSTNCDHQIIKNYKFKRKNANQKLFSQKKCTTRLNF